MKQTLIITLETALWLARKINHADVTACLEMTLADIRYWLAVDHALEDALELAHKQYQER